MKNKVFEVPADEELLELLSRKKRPLRLAAIMRAAGLERGARKNLEAALARLEESGALTRFAGGIWAPPDKLKTVEGHFFSYVRGGGHVVPASGGEDIVIAPHQTAGAWNQDHVLVAIAPDKGRVQGKVIRIIERAHKEVAAKIIHKQGKNLLCRPADRRLNVNFSVPVAAAPLNKRLNPGALVSLKPEKELAPRLWQAALINIFGAENNIDAQEALVKCAHHVPGAFPPLALRQAEAFPGAPATADMAARQDLRHIPFVTIDGADARDFDDAIQVENLADGWLLRVAIADVSHYARPDPESDSLDQEALRRGNSWYFPRSVEPMLPKALSNGVCSLKPYEDRLAMLVELAFSSAGVRRDMKFAPIVMRSRARLTYDEAFRFFANPEERGENIIPEIAGMLESAFRLYKILAQKRRQRGSLDFDLPEPAYKFDEEGRLAGMSVAIRNDAHKLIEEFMIAANEAVAFFLSEKNIPFLYRVHPAPEAAKIASLFETLRATALETLPPGLSGANLAKPETIREILVKAAGTPAEYAVNRLCLRAMNQARYQPENLGHFGLASEYYCHFTSPIRRYADLTVHRALKTALGIEKAPCPDVEILRDIGDRLNKLEREAMDCEREMAKRLGCLALAGHEGEIFKGSISGVTDFGLFVELDAIPVEGLLRIAMLGQGQVYHDPERQLLCNVDSGQVWRLGDAVEVKIEKVDLDRLEIRLALLHKADSDSRNSRRTPPARRMKKKEKVQSRAKAARPAAPSKQREAPKKAAKRKHR